MDSALDALYNISLTSADKEQAWKENQTLSQKIMNWIVQRNGLFG